MFDWLARFKLKMLSGKKEQKQETEKKQKTEEGNIIHVGLDEKIEGHNRHIRAMAQYEHNIVECTASQEEDGSVKVKIRNHLATTHSQYPIKPVKLYGPKIKPAQLSYNAFFKEWQEEVAIQDPEALLPHYDLGKMAAKFQELEAQVKSNGLWHKK